jgi:hypothetical protein
MGLCRSLGAKLRAELIMLLHHGDSKGVISERPHSGAHVLVCSTGSL